MHEETIVLKEDLTKRGYELTLKTHQIYRLIYFILGVIEAFLLIRFFFKLFGANPVSWFVSVVYGVSGVLLMPFLGVFASSAPAAGEGVARVFEPSSLVAAIIYALLAWGISRLLLIVRSRPVE